MGIIKHFLIILIENNKELRYLHYPKILYLRHHKEKFISLDFVIFLFNIIFLSHGIPVLISNTLEPSMNLRKSGICWHIIKQRLRNENHNHIISYYIPITEHFILWNTKHSHIIHVCVCVYLCYRKQAISPLLYGTFFSLLLIFYFTPHTYANSWIQCCTLCCFVCMSVRIYK